jgi:hypothetical protein
VAANFTLPTVLANLTAGNQPLSLIDGDFNAVANPLLALGTFSNYYTDTGVANAYAITVSIPQTVAQTAGLPIQFKATNANTGASTFQINALTVKNIVHPDGTALGSGEIPAGGIVSIIFDGTSYQLQSITPSSSPSVAAVQPNLLINPNWQIDQINEGALYTVTGGGADVQGPDGWSGTAAAAPGVFKLRTLADPDNAALKCLEITCTTADAAIAATDDYHIYTAIEGYDAASLMSGTASAQSATIQFKFKSNVTGVYGLSIANSAKNRSYVGIITVADTAEHEYTVSLTLDTTGTWLYTNGVGLYLRLTLAAGSNFQAAAGAWNAANNLTTSAQANFMSVNTNIAYLKRIQLIPGSLVQAYRPADIQKELAKCQRYYAKTFPQGTAVAQSAGTTGGIYAVGPSAGASFGTAWTFPMVMRTTPSIITYNPSAANATWRNISASSDLAVVVGAGGPSDRISNLAAGGSTVSQEYLIHATANARLS